MNPRGAQAEANMGVRGIARKGGQPDDPRMQYLKNLMLKYLCVDELEVLCRLARARAPHCSHRERVLDMVPVFTGQGAHGESNSDGAWLLRRGEA